MMMSASTPKTMPIIIPVSFPPLLAAAGFPLLLKGLTADEENKELGSQKSLTGQPILVTLSFSIFKSLDEKIKIKQCRKIYGLKKNLIRN